jgi:hypothetical protein
MTKEEFSRQLKAFKEEFQRDVLASYQGGIKCKGMLRFSVGENAS